MHVTKNSIYLDYAAATPLDKRVLRAMKPYFSDRFFNPSSPYEPARQVKRDLAAARHTVARLLGAKSTEIIFTAGATESINLAFSYIQKQGYKVAVSAIEHTAVMEAASNQKIILPVDESGRIMIERIADVVDDNTGLISIGLINHEIGTIQTLKQVAEVINGIRSKRRINGNNVPLWLHTDASQAAGLLDLSIDRLGIDMMSLNAAKIYGPKQMGLLWARSDIPVLPMIRGGGQEFGKRSGTENVAGIIGFTTALELAEKARTKETVRLQALRTYTIKTFKEAFPDCIISGSIKQVAAHIVHVAFPGIDAERLVFALEARGIFVATGSACAANHQTASTVLAAIGLDPSAQQGSLRLSFGRFTTKSSLKTALKAIIDCVQKEYARES